MYGNTKEDTYETTICIDNAIIDELLKKDEFKKFLDEVFVFIRTKSIRNRYIMEFRLKEDLTIHLQLIQTKKGVEINVHEDKFEHYGIGTSLSYKVLKEIIEVLEIECK